MATLVRLDAHARLVVPAAIRRQLGLRQGDLVGLEVTPEGDLRVFTLEKRLASAKGVFREYRRDQESVADELVRERRREARREADGG